MAMMMIQCPLLVLSILLTLSYGQFQCDSTLFMNYCTCEEGGQFHVCSLPEGQKVFLAYTMQSITALIIYDTYSDSLDEEGELPKDLFSEVGDNIAWLDIKTNYLKSISTSTIGQCSSLIFLHIKSSSFVTLAQDMLQSCSELLTISVESTRMISVPESPKDHSSKLESALFVHNQITQLPKDFINNLENIRIADFSFNQITAIPNGFLQKCNNLTFISFQGNKLSNLTSNLFRTCINLEELHIEGNQLDKLPEELFPGNNSKLRFFYAQNNSLQKLPNNFLANTKKVEELNLGFNKLSTIPKGFLGECKSLRILNLESNHIQSFLSSIIDNCTNLNGINLKNNLIVTLPAAFPSVCPRLSFLILDSNKINNINPHFLSRCSLIRYISLTGNALTHLHPDIFSKFPLLSTLKLNQNSFVQLPSGLTKNATFLRLLDVSENRLTTLSTDVLKADETSTLESAYNLSFNALNILQFGVFRYSNLPTTLDVSHNNISDLEDGWSLGLQQLLVLNLNDNNLDSLSIRDLMLLDNIKILNLANNKIISIEKYAFVHLNDLTALDLSQNNLNLESYYSPIIPHSLNTLNVSHNMITHFPTSWNRAAKMSVVDVSDNKISQNNLVRMMLSSTAENKVSLYMKGNYIQCPCDIVSIAQKHRKISLSDIDSSSCSSLNSSTSQCPAISGCPETCECSRNEDDSIFIDCNDSWLLSFPLATSLNVTMLDVGHSNISDLKNLCDSSWNSLTHFLANGAFFVNSSTELLKTNCFQHLTSLSVLDLGRNNITDLPENFLNSFLSLTSLNITKNAFHALPANLFKNVQHLKMIDLSSNKLQDLPKGIFDNLYNLTKLFLSGNEIKTLFNYSFHGLTNLAELHLEFNMVTTIEYDTFAPLKNLQVLDLSFNQISVYHMFHLPSSLVVLLMTNNNISGTFQRMSLSSRITTLDLRNNFLEKVILEIEDFDKIFLNFHLENNQIKQINVKNNSDARTQTFLKMYISGNPLVCDCEIASFVKFVGYHNSEYRQDQSVFIVSDNVICERPEFLKGKYLYELKLNELLCEDISSDCPEGCWCYNNVSNQGVILDCHAQPLKTLPETIPPNVTSLYLNDIYSIKSLNALAAPGYENISELWLRDCCNDISSFNFTILNTMHHLQRVEIDDLCYCRISEYIRFNSAGFSGPCKYPLPAPTCKMTDKDEWVWLECSSNFVPPRYLYAPMCYVVDDCFENCTCYFTNNMEKFVMNCSNSQLTRLPDKTPKNITILDMNYNSITELKGLLEPRWNMLMTLFIRHNNIKIIVDMSLPSNILLIDLEFNSLEKPSGWLNSVLSAKNNRTVSLKLAYNPWKCECDPPSFSNWSSSKVVQLVTDINATFCESNSVQLPFLQSFQCPISIEKVSLAVGLSVALISLLFIAVVIIVYFWQGKAIRLWLFTHHWCMCFIRAENIDLDKEFDAFISYSSDDAPFVARILLPGLEEAEDSRFRYKVCIHDRDWLVGGYIPSQIMQSVQMSRRTIIVLTKNFLKSTWANLEFQIAFRQALTDRINRIIIIIPEEVPSMDEMDTDLRLYISMNSYISFQDSKFWDKLRYSMPHKIPGGTLRRLPPDFIKMVSQERDQSPEQTDYLNDIKSRALMNSKPTIENYL